MKKVWVIIDDLDSDCISVVGVTTDPETAEAYRMFTPYTVECSFLDDVREPERCWNVTWSGPIGITNVRSATKYSGIDLNKVYRDKGDCRSFYAPRYTVCVKAETSNKAKKEGLRLIADAIHRDEEGGKIQNQKAARDEWLQRRKEQMERAKEGPDRGGLSGD